MLTFLPFFAEKMLFLPRKIAVNYAHIHQAFQNYKSRSSGLLEKRSDRFQSLTGIGREHCSAGRCPCMNELEVKTQEEHVGSFCVDILCVDPGTDKLVLIENQLEKTDHKIIARHEWN